MTDSAARPEAAEEAPEVTAATLQTLLERRPFGLFTDLDGTLSEIALTPQQAVVSESMRALLQALAERVHVIVITGRTLIDARRLVRLNNVIYVGSHGLATWIDGHEELDGSVRPYVELARRAMTELSGLRRIDGVLFEEKQTGLAIHYRLTRNAAEARAEIMRAIAASSAAAHFDLIEGVKVVELRPRLGINKGTSVRALTNRLRLEGLLYVGDDFTDVDAFEAVRDLRRGGRVDGLSVAVHHAETSPMVENAADYIVDGVAGVEQLLGYVARLLGIMPDRDASRGTST
jgi:trehalose 6-phosphate phosphatase